MCRSCLTQSIIFLNTKEEPQETEGHKKCIEKKINEKKRNPIKSLKQEVVRH
jgi:hypothetical protein